MKMRLILLALIIIGILIAVFLYLQDSTIHTKYDITIEQTKELLENPSIIVIDVRSKNEAPEGRLPHAITIDVHQAEFQEALQKLDKAREYLIYSNYGERSAKAIQAMEKAGFARLHRMKDGIEEWKKAGFPMDKPIQP